jgi:hypothetical protein
VIAVRYELYVWHEPAPISAVRAATKLAAWNAGDREVFPSHFSVPLLRAELLARGPGADRWEVSPAPGASVLRVATDARALAEVVRQGARRHGLVCYDPRRELVDPDGPALAAFTLSSARLAPVPDPGDELIGKTVRGLDEDNFFAVLERADGTFVQVGFGARAGAPAGVYALEFSGGDPQRHWRSETTDVGEAVRLVREFRDGGDSWRSRYAWRPLEL